MHVQLCVTYLQLIYYILNHKVDLWRAMIPLPATNPFTPAVMSQNHEFDTVRGNLERTILDLSSRKKRSFFREGTTKPIPQLCNLCYFSKVIIIMISWHRIGSWRFQLPQPGV